MRKPTRLMTNTWCTKSTNTSTVLHPTNMSPYKRSVPRSGQYFSHFGRWKQIKMFIGSNIHMSSVKHSGGVFEHKTCTKRRTVCIENILIILQNNCTTKVMRIHLIVLTSITSFTYTNITFYLYNGPYI